MKEDNPKNSSILMDHYRTKIIASMKKDKTFRAKVLAMIDENRSKTPQNSMNTQNSGVKPETIAKGSVVIGIYIKAGVYKFADIVEDAHKNIEEITEELLKGLRAAYAAYRENADEVEYNKMDSSTRDFKLSDLQIPEDELTLNNETTNITKKEKPEETYNPLKEHYKGIVKEYIKENHKGLYKSLTRTKLEEIAERRVKTYLEQMTKSTNPQMEKEVYFQDMLTF